MNEKAQKMRVIVDFFIQFQRRPESIIATDVPIIWNFLIGFNTMCDILRPDIMELYNQNKNEVMLRLGWMPSAGDPTQQMKDKHFSDENITLEYIRIELETWQQVLNKLKLK